MSDTDRAALDKAMGATGDPDDLRVAVLLCRSACAPTNPQLFLAGRAGLYVSSRDDYTRTMREAWRRINR